MNTELREKLIMMVQAQNMAWENITKSANRYGDVPESFITLRSDNALALDEIIKIHGWTGKSLVGEDGAVAAYQIARNAMGHPALMKSFLSHIKKAVISGEMNKIQAVWLEDSILYYEDKPQKCGTSFEWNIDTELTVNVTSVESANALRKELRLESLEEALKTHKNELRKELGGIPTDIAERKKSELAWMKSVGWR
jgi:hypothetical protein